MFKVKIIRKHKSQVTLLLNWLTLMARILRMSARSQVQANLDYMQEIRARKIQMDTQVAEMRMAKLSNELVLQDMKIEITKKQLEMLGVGKECIIPESAHAGW